MSPNSFIMFLKPARKPPTNRPKPEPISPNTTNAHTNNGSPNDVAVSVSIGHFARPCCRNTIASGIRKSQWLIQNSGILLVICVIFIILFIV